MFRIKLLIEEGQLLHARRYLHAEIFPFACVIKLAVKEQLHVVCIQRENARKPVTVLLYRVFPVAELYFSIFDKKEF